MICCARCVSSANAIGARSMVTPPKPRVFVDSDVLFAGDELAAFHGLADPKDTPILAAAVQAACPWLVSFNALHFQTAHATSTGVRPGEFVQQVRALLAQMSPGKAS